jgi:hypothetical protein
MKIDLVVTRHKALVAYLLEGGHITSETPVKEHVTGGDVKGLHVVGVLPLHLAAETASVTEIPLNLTPEMRGKELTVEEVRAIAGEPHTYHVRPVVVITKW